MGLEPNFLTLLAAFTIVAINVKPSCSSFVLLLKGVCVIQCGGWGLVVARTPLLLDGLTVVLVETVSRYTRLKLGAQTKNVLELIRGHHFRPETSLATSVFSEEKGMVSYDGLYNAFSAPAAPQLYHKATSPL